MLDNFLSMMAPPQGGDGGGGMISLLVVFGGMFAIMYFLMIRPQQKRQKEHQTMLSSIKRGDNVITSTGMHGKVEEVSDTTFLISIADNVKVRFEKSAIASKK